MFQFTPLPGLEQGIAILRVRRGIHWATEAGTFNINNLSHMFAQRMIYLPTSSHFENQQFAWVNLRKRNFKGKIVLHS
jgi:hypothetical protein